MHERRPRQWRHPANVLRHASLRAARIVDALQSGGFRLYCGNVDAVD